MLDADLYSESTPTIHRQWMAKKGKCYWFILENTRPQKNGLQIRINKQGKPVLARKRKPHLAFGNISLPNGIGRVERIFLYSFKGE